MMRKYVYLQLTVLLVLLAGTVAAGELAGSGSFEGDNGILVNFTAPVDAVVAGAPASYTVFEEADPDIRLEPASSKVSEDNKSVLLSFSEPLNMAAPHVVRISGLRAEEKITFTVSKSYLGYLFGILI